MNKEDIAYIIEVKHPLTNYSLKVDLNTDEFLVGIFVMTKDYDELKERNQWRFVINQKLRKWEQSNDHKLTEIIDGKYIDSITVL